MEDAPHLPSSHAGAVPGHAPGPGQEVGHQVPPPHPPTHTHPAAAVGRGPPPPRGFQTAAGAGPAERDQRGTPRGVGPERAGRRRGRTERPHSGASQRGAVTRLPGASVRGAEGRRRGQGWRSALGREALAASGWRLTPAAAERLHGEGAPPAQHGPAPRPLQPHEALSARGPRLPSRGRLRGSVPTRWARPPDTPCARRGGARPEEGRRCAGSGLGGPQGWLRAVRTLVRCPSARAAPAWGPSESWRGVTPRPGHTRSPPSCRRNAAGGRAGTGLSAEGSGAHVPAGRAAGRDSDGPAPSRESGACHTIRTWRDKMGEMLSARRELLSFSCRALGSRASPEPLLVPPSSSPGTLKLGAGWDFRTGDQMSRGDWPAAWGWCSPVRTPALFCPWIQHCHPPPHPHPHCRA